MRVATWNILYRGSLSSCNYACHYCPFAKTTNTAEELARDAAALERLVEWVGRQTHRRIGILITPWGEALIHAAYRRAMVRLSHMPHVYRVAIQTNLSGRLDELAEANRETLALWTTWHPGEVSRERFLARCVALDRLGIRYSVGTVGLAEHLRDIEELRAALPPERYLWVNAYKRVPDYYDAAALQRIQQVDPYFGLNNQVYASEGKACRAGESSFTVDAEGTMRRCHFIARPIGNIHDPDFEKALAPTPCEAQSCRCHIGYIHRQELQLDALFGDGLLDRTPAAWPQVDTRFTGQ